MNTLTVLKFSKENEVEFMQYSNRIPKEFIILSRHKFDNGLIIFLLTSKLLFRAQKVIGYSIVIDFYKLGEEKADLYSLVHKLDREIVTNPNCIYIEDFMISKYMRRKGIGTEFFNLLKHDFFAVKEFVLKPDGDGNKFWETVGFENKKDVDGFMIMNCN